MTVYKPSRSPPAVPLTIERDCRVILSPPIVVECEVAPGFLIGFGDDALGPFPTRSFARAVADAPQAAPSTRITYGAGPVVGNEPAENPCEPCICGPFYFTSDTCNLLPRTVTQIMPKSLTAKSIARLKPRAQRYETPDGGCSGLYVTTYPTKKKTFVVRFRFKGQSRKLTLGSVLDEDGVVEPRTTPATDTPLSLAAARQLCATRLREAKAGTDPCAEKRRKRQKERAAESDTLAAVAAEYLKREGPKLRTSTSARLTSNS